MDKAAVGSPAMQLCRGTTRKIGVRDATWPDLGPVAPGCVLGELFVLLFSVITVRCRFGTTVETCAASASLFFLRVWGQLGSDF